VFFSSLFLLLLCSACVGVGFVRTRWLLSFPPFRTRTHSTLARTHARYQRTHARQQASTSQRFSHAVDASIDDANRAHQGQQHDVLQPRHRCGSHAVSRYQADSLTCSGCQLLLILPGSLFSLSLRLNPDSLSSSWVPRCYEVSGRSKHEL
jgi:hypothetical protein